MNLIGIFEEKYVRTYLPIGKKEKTKSILEIDEITDSRAAADAYLNSCMRDMTSRNVKLCTYFVRKVLSPETQKITNQKQV